MKKAILFLFVIAALNTAVFSNEKNKNVSILFNPLLLFSDLLISDYDTVSPPSIYMFDMETHVKLSNYSNLSFSASFLFAEYSYRLYDTNYFYHSVKDDVFQFCLKPMYIHRPFGTGLNGFFIGFYPHFTYTMVSDNFDNVTNYYEIGGGFSVGNKWIFKSGFTIQTGFCIGKTFPLGKKQYDKLGIYSDGRIRIETTDIQLFEFKIGYSF